MCHYSAFFIFFNIIADLIIFCALALFTSPSPPIESAVSSFCDKNPERPPTKKGAAGDFRSIVSVFSQRETILFFVQISRTAVVACNFVIVVVPTGDDFLSIKPFLVSIRI